MSKCFVSLAMQRFLIKVNSRWAIECILMGEHQLLLNWLATGPAQSTQSAMMLDYRQTFIPSAVMDGVAIALKMAFPMSSGLIRYMPGIAGSKTAGPAAAEAITAKSQYQSLMIAKKTLV